MSFGYTIDRKITEVLKEKDFTVSAEIVPPRNGEDQIQTIKKLEKIMESGLHFLSVTKGAGGSLRGGSLPIAQSIKDHFSKPCIAHFTCRDLVPQEIESHLIDHHYFGIRNILALRGDPPMGVDDWLPREGGYSYAFELIKQIREMNNGSFLKRQGFDVNTKEKTDFCIGAAVYPEHPDPKERLEFTRLKFAEGAEYGITQMLFDPDAYGQLIEDLRKININAPILPGLRILKSQQQADIMEQRFACRVPEWYRQALPEDKTTPLNYDQLLEPFYKLVTKLREYGAPGVHIFVLADTAISTAAMAELIRR